MPSLSDFLNQFIPKQVTPQSEAKDLADYAYRRNIRARKAIERTLRTQKSFPSDYYLIQEYLNAQGVSWQGDIETLKQLRTPKISQRNYFE